MAQDDRIEADQQSVINNPHSAIKEPRSFDFAQDDMGGETELV